MGNLSDVALQLQHMAQFVQTAVAKAVTDEVADLLQPSGHALSEGRAHTSGVRVAGRE